MNFLQKWHDHKKDDVPLRVMAIILLVLGIMIIVVARIAQGDWLPWVKDFLK